ncbi:helix-turn-helix domain-containing protein [Streptomyces sp. NPDC002851]
MTAAKQPPHEQSPAGERLDDGPERERPWSTPGADQGSAPSRARSSREPGWKGDSSADTTLTRPSRHATGHATRGGSNRLLTVEEVAAWLRVSEHTLRNNYRSWGLKPQKVGRLLRFRERDITHYLDEHYG